jgi:uncharacterized membrane protein YsdA (DUF1294 family)
MRPSTSTQTKSKPWGFASIISLAGFTLALLTISQVRGISLYVALGYFLMSLLCGFFYWLDKRAAQNGQWRVSEAFLLGLSFAGGWPGAIVAQQMLRHKTSKVSFRIAFWLTVAFNILAFVVATTPLLAYLLK